MTAATAAEQKLRLMANLSTAIIELDLEQEGGVERLIELQEQQWVLREQLAIPFAGDLRKDSRIQGMLGACLELEKDVNRKLTIFRNHVSEQMNKLNEGNKSKTAYAGSFIQTEGYFIDFKK